MTTDGNPSIKMVETPNKGRAIVSCRPLKAGEIVLRDSPILLYSAAPLGTVSNHCSNCFRTIPPHSPTSVPCPQCAAASLFCTQQCQSIALSTSHTPFVCQALTRLAAADSPIHRRPHDRHAQARFLVAAYNLAVVSPAHFQTFLSLQGEPFIDEAAIFLHSAISSVWPPSSNLGGFGFSLELTAALLAKDSVNAFGLMEPFREDEGRSTRAYGIYPRASFFNHDCLPNACRFDYVDSVSGSGNTDIVVRAIHDVSAGREICLSYFPVNLKYSERQQRLKEDYGFACDCDRCNVEANWSDNEDEGDDEMDHEDNDMNGDDDVGDDLETTVDCGVDDEDVDFPHAYFFMRYMCSRENCGGTLAPLPPVDARPSIVMECNVCGNLSNSEE